MPEELIMAFTCVRSQGGPYDDLAFCAGYRLGVLDAMIQHAKARGVLTITATLPTADFHQADLIAMRHDWLATDTGKGRDGWTSITFTRGVEP